MTDKNKAILRNKQSGAIAIEFAALLMVFFIMLYAIMAYSIPLLLTLTFKQVSADAARAAVRVDPDLAHEDYLNIINRELKRTVDDSWLPANWVQGGCPAPADGWIALPAAAEDKPLGHYLKIESLEPYGASRYHLNVCLQRIYNKAGGDTEGSIIPTLSFLGMDIPSLPKEGSDTIIRGRSAIRL